MEMQVHAKGNTSVLVDQRSEQIITLGEDGKLTIWDSLDDDEQLKTYVIGGKCHSLALKGDSLYTANANGNGLVSYSLESGQSEGLITRFTSPITDITSNGTHVAAGASDFMIRCVNAAGDVSLLEAHEAPILSLCLSPVTGHLLSASGDGTVKLWIIKTKCCLQTFNILPKVSDVSLSESLCKMSWKWDGVQFAVPVGKKVYIYSKDKEEADHVLKHETIVEPINACSYSKDNQLLAVATTNGYILVWSCPLYEVVYSDYIQSKAAVTSLCWLDAKSLLFGNNQGCLGRVEVKSSGQPSEKPADKLSNEEIADMFDGSDDGDFMDTEAAEECGDIVEEHEEEVKHSKKGTKANNVIDDDDLDSVMSEAASVSKPASDRPADPPSDAIKSADTPSAALVTDEQEPFQPGSTPTHHKNRYMVWNSVGMIRSYSSEDDSTIDIEFHDTSRHHTIHLSNSEGFSMADLGEECAVLATEDSGRGRSSLLCINYGGGDDKQQWGVSLDKHETVECVCVGGDFVAMATSKHMVRGFSTAGFQLAPFLLPGAPVAMAGYRNVLMIVYHTGPALNGYQHLSVSILTMTGPREVLTHCSKLPLTGTSTLVWLGFTGEGTPVMFDSNGIMSMYRMQGHDIWTPVVNTKAKDKHSNPFIVSVAEAPPQIRCVPCKGSAYPSTSNRPVLGILEYQIPLCALDTDTGTQEEMVWRNRLLMQASNNWLSERVMDMNSNEKQEQTSLLKLFSSACREERFERAYQIAGLMSQAYVKLAAQYANRTHQVELAVRLTQLAQQKADSEGEPAESVFGYVQPSYGLATFRPVADGDETAEADELTRFTAARFSTPPNKSLVRRSRSQPSPLTMSVDDTEVSVSAAVEPSGNKSGQPARISFANILSQPHEDSQLSQDSQTSRSNAFKRKSTESVKHTSIVDLHKMLDEQEMKKQEQKKALSVSHQAPKTKQPKLFSKANKVTDENSHKPKRKVTAFELYHKEQCAGKSRSEAMDTFKTLNKDTKKEYMKRADALNSLSPAEEAEKCEERSVAQDESAEKKRKLDSTETKTGTERATLTASENTKSKLASFANN